MNTYLESHIKSRIEQLKKHLAEAESHTIERLKEYEEGKEKNLDSPTLHYLKCCVEIAEQAEWRYEYALKELETVQWFMQFGGYNNGR